MNVDERLDDCNHCIHKMYVGYIHLNEGHVQYNYNCHYLRTRLIHFSARVMKVQFYLLVCYNVRLT